MTERKPKHLLKRRGPGKNPAGRSIDSKQFPQSFAITLAQRAEIVSDADVNSIGLEAARIIQSVVGAPGFLTP